MWGDGEENWYKDVPRTCTEESGALPLSEALDDFRADLVARRREYQRRVESKQREEGENND
jgi:hypothetical protein